MSSTGDLEEMPTLPPQLTCEQVDQQELDTRYVRGQLDAARSEAFEAHYFACDRCWELVRAGNQVRAARSASPRQGFRSSRVWWIAAAAALAAVVGASVLREWRTERSETVETLRSGSGDLAPPVAGADGTRLTVSWRPMTEAGSYRVRLFGGDGAMLLERELTDTTFSVARDSVAAAAPSMVWQVHALDRLGGEIARYPLTSIHP